MLERFKAEVADCLGALTQAQREDFCWEGGSYFLSGDWRNPTVGLAVGPVMDVPPGAQRILVCVSVEPLLFPCEPDGKRLDDVHILRAREMLLKTAVDLGVASILLDGWKQAIALPGIDPEK